MGNSPQRAAGLATKRSARAAQQQIGVTYQPGAEAALARIAGQPTITEAQTARLAGAQPGAHVEAIHLGGDIAQLRVTGPGVRSDTWLVRDRATGERTLHVNYLLVEPSGQSQGLGTRMWATQAREARRQGYAFATLDAGRRDEAEARATGQPAMHGYRFWPSLGFDTPMGLAVTDGTPLPSSLSGAKMVSDLFKTAEGTAWWRAHGSSTAMRFDLRRGSASWRGLNGTLRRRRGGRGK